MCITRTSEVSAWPRGEEQVALKETVNPVMHNKLWQGQVMVEELEQLVAKRFERGTPESGNYEFLNR